MKKEIVIKNEKLQEEFMCIMAIGLIESLKNNIIDTRRAEQWLFSPVVAYSLKKTKYSEIFIDAMKNASEIDAMVNTDYYLKNLQEIGDDFIDVYKNIKKCEIDSSINILDGLN